MKILMLVLFVGLGMQAQELVSGKATLTKISDGIYEIKKDDGTEKKIDIRPNVDEHVTGTLAVFFNDCENLRKSVFDLKLISEDDLIRTVKQYNNCNYTPFKPTEKEARRAANFQGDKYKLFASIGPSINRVSFFGLDDYKNLTEGQLSFGVAATPGFTGSLQGNLYVTLEVSAAFSGDKDFDNSPFKTNFNKNSQKANLGLEYHFNKNGSIIPLIGIGVGLSNDRYKGSYDGHKLNEREGNAFVMPKLGVLFSLDEKKSLGVILSYIPKYENDLSFRDGDEIVPLIIQNQYFNAGLYFYF